MLHDFCCSNDRITVNEKKKYYQTKKWMDAFNDHHIGHESNSHRNKNSELSKYSGEISHLLNILLNILNF